ncbi:sensor histidine kinase [Georgenia ruanii]|nr:histidine kinase [Georgenia ruanii]
MSTSEPLHRHAGTMVRAALLARLASLGAALVWLVVDGAGPAALVAVVVLSLETFVALAVPGVRDLVARHPLAVVADSVMVFAVLAMVGTTSPVVLATLSTALMYGVLFERRLAALLGVMLVALYVLASEATLDPEPSFMGVLGVPTLFLSMLALGMAARGSYARQARLAAAAAAESTARAAAEERARLARELHDSLGKSLHGISLLADGLPQWIDKDVDRARQYAAALADGARQAAAETRQIVTMARMDQPDRPLAEVLHEMCARWEAAQEVPCSFTHRCVVDLSTDARYEVVAIVGEALENVARHAAASRVQVELARRDDGAIEVLVADDGRGFCPRPDGTSPRGHYGLTGMHERARLVGAELTIVSAAGEGTRVRVVCREEGHDD